MAKESEDELIAAVDRFCGAYALSERRAARRTLFVSALLVAALAALVAAGFAWGAPAPFYRAPRPAPVAHVTPGHYRMAWCGTEWDVQLRGDGYYLATAGDSVWSGGWSYDAGSRTLAVTESCGGATIDWSSALDVLLAGKIKGWGGSDVALVRR